MKRVLVCGSRDWRDPTPIRYALAKLQAAWGSFEVVDDGMSLKRCTRSVQRIAVMPSDARGADTLARQAARDLGLMVREFPANWKRYGKAAGMIRNQEMLDYLLTAEQCLVLAFPLPLSRGTWDMIQRAKRAGIETRVFAPVQTPPRNASPLRDKKRPTARRS